MTLRPEGVYVRWIDEKGRCKAMERVATDPTIPEGFDLLGFLSKPMAPEREYHPELIELLDYKWRVLLPEAKP